MGLDNGAKSRARRKHHDKCASVKGNGMREKLEALWEDELVRAPGHVAGHLTEAAAVTARKGYYKRGEPHIVAQLSTADGDKVVRGVPLVTHPVTGAKLRPYVKAIPPEPSAEELVTCLGREATKPRPFKVDWS